MSAVESFTLDHTLVKAPYRRQAGFEPHPLEHLPEAAAMTMHR